MKPKPTQMKGVKGFKYDIDIDTIIDMYTARNMKMCDIAKEFNVTLTAISDRLKDAGVNVTSYPHKNKYSDDAEWLRTKYVTERLSMKAIADIAGVSASTVNTWLTKHKIPTRSIRSAKMKTGHSIIDSREFFLHEYVEQNKTTMQISHETGISETCIQRALVRHGIDLRRGYFSAGGQSIEETALRAFVETLCDGVEFNVRNIIAPKELDIFIPSMAVAIEYNGIPFHCEGFGRGPSYHIEKTRQCLQQNINLIHINSIEWNTKNDIVKSILRSKLGKLEKCVYARKCSIEEVSSPVAAQFFNKTHLKGSVRSKFCYALVHDSTIVCCASVSPHRFGNMKSSLELTRFSSQLDTYVVGGLSKLMKHIANKHKMSIESYADRCYSNGRGYVSAGFELVGHTRPGYSYVIEGQLKSRHQFQKHKLKGILPNFSADKTEWENMRAAGFDRLWDCGNLKFVFNR